MNFALNGGFDSDQSVSSVDLSDDNASLPDAQGSVVGDILDVDIGTDGEDGAPVDVGKLFALCITMSEIPRPYASMPPALRSLWNMVQGFHQHVPGQWLDSRVQEGTMGTSGGDGGAGGGVTTSTTIVHAGSGVASPPPGGSPVGMSPDQIMHALSSAGIAIASPGVTPTTTTPASVPASAPASATAHPPTNEPSGTTTFGQTLVGRCLHAEAIAKKTLATLELMDGNAASTTPFAALQGNAHGTVGVASSNEDFSSGGLSSIIGWVLALTSELNKGSKDAAFVRQLRGALEKSITAYAKAPEPGVNSLQTGVGIGAGAGAGTSSLQTVPVPTAATATTRRRSSRLAAKHSNVQNMVTRSRRNAKTERATNMDSVQFMSNILGLGSDEEDMGAMELQADSDELDVSDLVDHPRVTHMDGHLEGAGAGAGRGAEPDEALLPTPVVVPSTQMSTTPPATAPVSVPVPVPASAPSNPTIVIGWPGNNARGAHTSINDRCNRMNKYYKPWSGRGSQGRSNIPTLRKKVFQQGKAVISDQVAAAMSQAADVWLEKPTHNTVEALGHAMFGQHGAPTHPKLASAFRDMVTSVLKQQRATSSSAFDKDLRIASRVMRMNITKFRMACRKV